MVGEGAFPAPLRLESNIEHVRAVLADTVALTACRESYSPVARLEPDADFFRYQEMVNRDLGSVESHAVIDRRIERFGEDYRFEVAPNPRPELRDRKQDNVTLGRKPRERELTRA